MTEEINFKKVKKSKNGFLADGMFIPKEKSNRHYEALEKWIEKGGNVEEEFDLPEIQLTKCDEVETLRKIYQFENIIYQNNIFSTSPAARQDLTGIVIILNNSNLKYYWKDVDEKIYEFGFADFKELLQIILKRDSKLHYVEAQIKRQIKDKNQKLNSLENLDIKALWQEEETKYKEPKEEAPVTPTPPTSKKSLK
jgi:hypothetical protein